MKNQINKRAMALLVVAGLLACTAAVADAQCQTCNQPVINRRHQAQEMGRVLMHRKPEDQGARKQTQKPPCSLER